MLTVTNRDFEQDRPVVVDSVVVSCDGDGDLGHPLVYLHIDDTGEVACPYCSRRFVLADGGREAAAH